MTTQAVSKRALSIPTSATVGIADTVSGMRREGIDVVDFSAGRASEHTPGYVVRAASDAMAAGDTHQTMAQGKPEFREACAQKLRRDNGIDADPETELIATLGCKQGLFLALLATLDDGDEVLVEDPGFVSYEPAVRYCGGVAVPVPLRAEERFRWSAKALSETVTPRTRTILLCSPHNPTGVVHSSDDLEVIASVAREHDLLVYADETYERLTWDGRELPFTSCSNPATKPLKVYGTSVSSDDTVSGEVSTTPPSPGISIAGCSNPVSPASSARAAPTSFSSPFPARAEACAHPAAPSAPRSFPSYSTTRFSPTSRAPNGFFPFQRCSGHTSCITESFSAIWRDSPTTPSAR